ncbi:MAG TPA: zinc-dependent metalloprotease [Vicinamibacterales bacterium]|nr:zinc-dependent metalloprotease [Vicinamibacterales bacterium]
MLRRFVFLLAVLFSVGLLTTAPFHAQGRGGGQTPAQGGGASIGDRLASMQKIDGLFPLYWEDRTGSLFLEIPKFDSPFLYVTGLAAGLGSNDIGLDRGIAGGGRIVHFERVGPKVFLVQPNENFRSSSVNVAERKSVEDSFAKSILWGFTVAGETNGHVIVDATPFLVRDVFGAAGALRPGTYRVDQTRSAIYMPRTKAFPKNTEIETTLTFVNDAANGRGGGAGPAQGPQRIEPPAAGGGGRGGGLFSGTVASVTPSADAVTLREHVSLVELPDDGYKPRYDDPRAGYGGLNYVDYSVPIGDQMVQRYIRRHRLEKKDPNAAISEPVKPIQYWVDSGAPDDVKKALVEGASWWSQAFDAAGFRNAFKVDVLPEGADPMDIRYNMINWVHRSTRGWSTGGSIADPRTGEIIKATVTLGSLRDRQDYLIFEGLLSPYVNGNEHPQVLYEAALKRIRQLAAHETGHTLGLGHNYYDSTKGWISVMDYPHPLEKLNPDGTIDINDAYPQHIGDWDKVTINYGYRQFPPGTDEKAALTKILDDAWKDDLIYLTNQDLDAHPKVDQWSNGVDQADELFRMMKVRRAALDHMGEHSIRAGMPMATIEEPLVPIYMYHRYAVESASSMVAGQDYIYGMRGDNRTPTKGVGVDDQRKALDALMYTLRPNELTVPKHVLDLIPPRPPGWGMHRELFPRTTGDTFDPLAPATIAADVTVGFLLQLDRAARMVGQHAVDPRLPGLEDVIDRLTAATFDATTANPYEAAVRRAEEQVLVDRVMWLATASPNSGVRAIATMKLTKLMARLKTPSPKATELDNAHRTLMAGEIKRFLDRPAEAARVIEAPPPDAPPGAPIGDMPMDWLQRPKW